MGWTGLSIDRPETGPFFAKNIVFLDRYQVPILIAEFATAYFEPYIVFINNLK